MMAYISYTVNLQCPIAIHRIAMFYAPWLMACWEVPYDFTKHHTDLVDQLVVIHVHVHSMRSCRSITTYMYTME